MVDLLKAARGQMCTVRIPGYCNHDPETSVLAHYRLAGTCGTAIKPHDMQAAIACSSCHDFNRRAGKNQRLHQRRITPDACRRCFSHTRNLEKGGIFYDFTQRIQEKAENTFVSPRWKVSGFRENYVCGGAGRILVAVRRGICLT